MHSDPPDSRFALNRDSLSRSFDHYERTKREANLTICAITPVLGTCMESSGDDPQDPPAGTSLSGDEIYTANLAKAVSLEHDR